MDLAEFDRYKAGTPIVHKMSFGKDSYATLLELIDHGIRPRVALYNDTGWEDLEHYDYMEREKERLLRVYGVDTVTTRAHFELTPELLAMALEVEAVAGLPRPSAMIRGVFAKGGFFPRPGRGMKGGKWCTTILKVFPGNVWLEAEDIEPDPVLTTGVRAEESITRATYPVWEKQHNKPYYMEWRPLLRHLVGDVGAILTRHGIPRHPLYVRGTSRVGCWPCINITKDELEILGRDTRRMAALRLLEEFASRLRSDEDAAFLQAKHARPGEKFARPVPIDEAVEWSRTSRGGVKFLLFPRKIVDPCDRWGWCEV